MKTFAEVAFTPAVQDRQAAWGSRAAYARMQAGSPGPVGLGAPETEFHSSADSFYMATVSETGWPYVQHRGGPRGFVKVLSPTRIAFADFRGNRQYVSAGNASRNDRVALIVMDYARRRRLKLLGHLRFEDIGAVEPGLAALVELPGYRARVEHEEPDRLLGHELPAVQEDRDGHEIGTPDRELASAVAALPFSNTLPATRLSSASISVHRGRRPNTSRTTRTAGGSASRGAAGLPVQRGVGHRRDS